MVLATAPSHRGEGGRWSPAQCCVCFGVGMGEKVRIPRENGKPSVKMAETRLRNVVLGYVVSPLHLSPVALERWF